MAIAATNIKEGWFADIQKPVSPDGIGANSLVNSSPKLLRVGPKKGFVLFQGHGMKDGIPVVVTALYQAPSMPAWIL